MTVGSDQDQRVGQMAVQRGFLTKAQLDECTRILSEEAYAHMEADAPLPALGDILVRRGYLTPRAFAQIERDIESGKKDETEREKESERRLGKYRLIREVGRGGMSVVWEAYDTELKRRTAIKFLSSHHQFNRFEVEPQDDEVVKRFYREAQTAARLNHPNVIRIYEVGIVEQAHFIAMEFLEGKTLNQAVEDGEVDLRQLMQHMRDAVRGVQHAHDFGVLHRDIKPQNIMMCAREGAARRVIVTDFGLARNVDEQERLTVSGVAIGTPAYMSPEHAQGSKGLVDPRSDVYSLGAVLYEALTGRPPFEGEEPMQVMLAVVNDEPRAPRKYKPSIPEEVELICLKAMAKDPSQRYPTARELEKDIIRFLDGDPVMARRPGVVYKIRKHVLKYPGATVAVAFAVMVSIMALFYMWVVQRDRNVAFEYHVRRASEHWHAGEYRMALMEYDSALRIVPGDDDVRAARAFVEEKRREAEAKTKKADEVRKTEEEQKRREFEATEAYHHANLLREKKDYEDAIAEYSRATELNPKMWEAFHWRAHTLELQNDQEGALEDYLHSLTLQPDSADLLRDIGKLYRNREEWEKALDYLSRAVEERPGFADAQHHLGHVKEKLDDLSGAETAYSAAIRVSARAEHLLDRARVRLRIWHTAKHRDRNRLSGANRDATAAIAVDNTRPNAYYMRGVTWHNLHAFDKAIRDYEKALKLNHEDPDKVRKQIEKARQRKSAEF